MDKLLSNILFENDMNTFVDKVLQTLRSAKILRRSKFGGSAGKEQKPCEMVTPWGGLQKHAVGAGIGPVITKHVMATAILSHSF